MKLIFHIGAGKTGSSSIQQTLNNSKDVLEENGICYSGLLFEKIDMKLYPWQNTADLEKFHTFSLEKTEKELLDLLKNVSQTYAQKNIHTLIWSNESFFGRMHKVLPVLKKFEKEGHEVEIISYVRRHDSWARSAYVQWGIKHKTYLGRMIPFSTWIKERIPNFSHGLNEVLTIFPDNFIIRNMDGVKDVVTDFLSVCKLEDLPIRHIRDNDAPGNEELLLRAVFNDQFSGQVLPKRFDDVVGNKTDFTTSQESYLSELLPSHQEITDLIAVCREDRDRVNTLLKDQGQVTIDETPLQEKNYTINQEILVKNLCDIVLKQSLQIERLEKLVTQKLNAH